MIRLLHIFLFILPVYCISQDFKISSYVNTNEIYQNEYVKFIVEANQRIELRNLRLANFNIVQGPFTSQSSQTTFINGKIQSKSEYKSTFLLSPKKSGSLAIESITVNYNNKEYKTEVINIDVKENEQTNSNNNTQQNNTNQSQTLPKNKTYNKNLFARISASRTKPYLGENLLLTYKIYQSVYNSSNIEITDYDLPMVSDFWTENIDPKGKQWPQAQEQINGIRYRVFTLKKEIVSPQKTGKISIPAFEVTALLNRDWFNRGQQKSIKSNSISLDVQPLPGNAPKTFNGQVGKNYELNVNFSKEELLVDEALDFDISIYGNGNLKQLKLPTVDFPTDMEKYPAETKNKIKITTNGISGKKSLHHLLIPRFHGEYKIPEFKFTYFDVTKKKYITLKKAAQSIKVNKNSNKKTANENSAIISIPNQENVELINQNIRHIREETELFENKTPLFGSIKYWSILGTIPISLLFIFLFLNNKDRFTDQDKIAFKKVKKEVLQKFNTAETNLKNGNTTDFYKELYTGWTLYISNKLKIKRANLTNESIITGLKTLKVDANQIAQMNAILNECEMAQYSPSDIKDAENTLSTSMDLMSKFEQNG